MSKPVHNGRTTSNGKTPARTGPPFEVIVHMLGAYHRLGDEASERPTQLIDALLAGLSSIERAQATLEYEHPAEDEEPWSEEQFWDLAKACGFVLPEDPGALAVPAPEMIAPRPCDLNKCTEPGHAQVGISVAAYTGRQGDELTLIICQSHAEQLEARFIAGFAWTPVYAHELPKAPPATEPAAAPEATTEPAEIAESWPRQVDEYLETADEARALEDLNWQTLEDSARDEEP